MILFFICLSRALSSTNFEEQLNASPYVSDTSATMKSKKKLKQQLPAKAPQKQAALKEDEDEYFDSEEEDDDEEFFDSEEEYDEDEPQAQSAIPKKAKGKGECNN